MNCILCEDPGTPLWWLRPMEKCTNSMTRMQFSLYQTREEGSLQDGKFRSSCCPWIVVKFCYQLVFYIATAGLKYVLEVTIGHKETCAIHQKPGTKILRWTTIDRLRDLLQWLEELRQNLEDTEVTETAHISRDLDSERSPKDRNCEVCL